MATGDEEFVDYYAVLDVSPGCDSRALEAAYHKLAKRYHPDRSGSRDSTEFSGLVAAYRILREPTSRADYDIRHAHHAGRGQEDYRTRAEVEIEERAAISDAEAHARILRHLYRRRRDNAQDAGVIAWTLQEVIGCSEELFDFHKWYLKEKGFIAIDEQGSVAITIAGVDHVIALSRGAVAEKLRIASEGEGDDA